MTKLKIAFDVDDTLIVPSIVTGLPYETPNYETIKILKWFQEQGYEIYIWSGSGIDWAKTWAEKLNLQPCQIAVKGSFVPDLCFDDCDVKLATVNVKVQRINNSISRKEWNETKHL